MPSSHSRANRSLHFPAIVEAASSSLPESGEILNGRYRIDREVGRTEAGVVFDGTDRTSNRRVAVELASSLHEPLARRRWARDAMMAQRLEGEHVLRVLDVGNLGNETPYVARESALCTLASEIDARGPLPVADAVAWTLEACEAIAEAHAIGMAHGDLRLENVFLARGAEMPIVKVAWTSAAKAERAAPEDVKRDIAALGTMLRILATGQISDEADGAPTLPSELTHAVARATAMGSVDAFHDVAELARAIAPFAPAGHRSAEAIAFLMSRAGLASEATPARAPANPDEAGVYTAIIDERYRDRASVSDTWFRRGARAPLAEGGSRRGWAFTLVSMALVGAVLGGSWSLWRNGSLPRWTGTAPSEDVGTTQVTSAPADGVETTPAPAVVEPPAAATAPPAPSLAAPTPVQALPNAKAEPATPSAPAATTVAPSAPPATAAPSSAKPSAQPSTQPSTPSTGSEPVGPAATVQPITPTSPAPSSTGLDPASGGSDSDRL